VATPARHRAKNVFSVVHAIARQTAAKNPEDFIERFSERIQALSASQDLLVRNEWNGVEIEDMVRAQLAHLADPHWFSHWRPRPQAAVEGCFRASHRARAR
jgi:two-component sensor histidine kinase